MSAHDMHPPIPPTPLHPPDIPALYSVGTFNARGALNESVEDLLNKIIKLDLDYCAVQDTGKHVSPYPFLNAGYFLHFKPPAYKDKSGGLALIVKSSLKQLITPVDQKEQQISPRIWIFNSLFPTKHKIFIVYNKNTKKEILTQLSNLRFGDYDILLGDLNSYSNPFLDFATSSPSPRPNIAFMEKLKTHEWEDSFRALYPEK